jgi:two-component system, NtrC family, nitrogen regulation response regulator GlnG
MRRVLALVEKLAVLDITDLLEGETGTGKELVARAIHCASLRCSGPFLPVNCGGIPDSLITSEMFGAERGAFTGADARRQGWFESANHGTLFLDEVGELSLPAQAVLLRAIEEKRITRVGGRSSIELDLRIVAATNRNLLRMVETGGFRRDLYARLAKCPILLPPLRERASDIPLLVEHLMALNASTHQLNGGPFEEDAIELLMRQSWPQNVRQLDHIVFQGLLHSAGGPVTCALLLSLLKRADLPSSDSTLRALVSRLLDQAEEGALPGLLRRLHDEIDAEAVAQAMDRAKGRQSRAARLLDIDRNTLREKLRHFSNRDDGKGKPHDDEEFNTTC